MRPALVAYLNNIFQTDIFGWIIPTSSQIYGLAFMLAAFAFLTRSRNSGTGNRVLWNSLWIGGLGAFLGAKFLYVLMHFRSYLLLPSHIFAPGGSVSFGAYAGALIAVFIYFRYQEKAALPLLDIAASVLPAGIAVGRWSCFLNGDDFGKISNVFWSVRYPHGSYPFAEHVNEGIISHTSALSAPVHPNQIYLSINALLIFIMIGWFWKRYRCYPGLTLSVYALFYSLTRFFLEFFRDEATVRWFPQFIFPQVVCLIIAAVSLISTIYILQKHHLIHLIPYKNSLSQKGESYEAVTERHISTRHSGTDRTAGRL